MTVRRFPIMALILASGLSGCAPGADSAEVGAWAGDMQLCQDTVEKVRASLNRQTGEPMVRIYLTEDGADRFRSLTAATVGKHLDIRVHGDVISSPMIAEPVTGARFDVVGVSEAQAGDLRAQALGPC